MKKYTGIIIALSVLFMMGNQAVGQEYFQGKATYSITMTNEATSHSAVEVHYKSDGSFASDASGTKNIYIAGLKTNYTVYPIMGRNIVAFVHDSLADYIVEKELFVHPEMETMLGRNCIKVSTKVSTNGIEINSTTWIDTTVNCINKATPTGKGLDIKSISISTGVGISISSETVLIDIESGDYDADLFIIPSEDEANWVDVATISGNIKKAKKGDKAAMKEVVSTVTDIAIDYAFDNKDYTFKTSDETYKKDIKDSTVVMVFHAYWSLPCTDLMSKIRNIAKEHNGEIKVLTANVDECPKATKKYKAKEIPLIIVMKDGKEIGRLHETDLTGTEDEIWKKIETVINK